ncbi:hypothetical protein GR160_08270 [Flavobacterium sp. Sd200]|uniref:hypothetical protein n=1 Tax=Flavobacterium sp. Sd200 TaxID=2692211 RepID=UPI00136EE16D|nr:hypothetical protein [Flavobacterium sp. Sd200]MXN91222.1 hypothetical protein [Flavobacterium sp. Sd200]
MKKTALLLLFALFIFSCKSGSKTTGKSDKADVETHYRDDFRSADAKEKSTLLKDLKATQANYSVLIFTQNFKGEKIVVSNAAKKLYSNYVISNLKTGIADKTRIDNTADTKIFDNLTKTEIVLPAKETAKHKFIYVMKNTGGNSTFMVTYSNTLRPLQP